MQARTRKFSPAELLLIGALLLFFALTALHAHGQVVGGTLSGTVTDETGAALANVAVVVHNDETGNERNLTTGPDGRYAAPSVPVGIYTITAQHPGFAAQRRVGIPLTVGQSKEIDLTLTVNAVTEQITVEDRSPVVNLSTEQISGLVDERQIKQLPLNGRSYDQLITLNPATVNYTGQRSGGVGTSNSSVGNMFAISGRRPQDNLFLLNGVEYTGASLINITPGGTSGQLLGVDAVREFNVVTDTYSAAYGKRQGAQISIVTASGTNSIHGSAYEFIRNSALDARNYFDQANIPNFQRNNFGGSVGGPVRRDKLFLFANYEGYRQNLGLSDVTLVPDNASRAKAVDSVKPLLQLWPVQNGPELGGGIAYAYSNPIQHIREDFGTTRFDYNIGSKDLLFAVYTIDDSMANTPSANPYSLVNEALREQVLSTQWQHVFSPTLLNTARFGYSRGAYFFTGFIPSDINANIPGWVAGKTVGAIVIAGSTASNGASQITGAGANVGSNNTTARNLFTFDDHIFYTRGRHQIEAGGWAQRIQSNDNLAQNQYGQASFSTLSSFLAGTVATFTVVPAPTLLGWRSTQYAGYVEDTVKLTQRLELRAGFRFEGTNGWNESQGRAANYAFNDGVIATNPTVGSNALAVNNAKFLPEPRIGLAWDPYGNGRTAIRGGFGIHRALLDNLDYRLDQTAPFNTTVSVKNIAVNKLNFTTTSTPPAGSLVSPSNVQPDIDTPTVLSWYFKAEQQIAPNTSLTVAYIGSHGYHQILSEDQNEPIPVTCPNPACPSNLAVGTVYFPSTVKANPLVANTTSWVSQGTSLYNALEVDVRRSFANGLQFRGNYTFSKNLDNGSAWNTSVSGNTPAFVSNPFSSKADWGPAATDVRHLASINGTYDLPFGRGDLSTSNAFANRAISGWTFSTIAALQTGFPFTPQLGYNPTGSGDTRNPVRPDVNPNFRGNLYPGTPTQFFNPAAFLTPAAGAIGNLGRDTLTGPSLINLDTSLLKTTHISERVNAQFRAEFFNVLNRTNFATPNPVIYSSGPTPTTLTAASVVSPTAGVITATATSSRQIQFGLKLLF